MSFGSFVTLAVASAVILIAEARVCPDGISACDDSATCCMLEGDKYGCCPLPDAMCCNDHRHCCPDGSKCDVQSKRCLFHWGGSVSMRRNEPARRVTTDEITCDDKRTKCEDDQTCCALSHGQYGCCPMPDAVCCQDHLHCCPEGTTCNTEQGMCTQKHERAVPWFRTQHRHHSSRNGHKKAVKTTLASTPCDDGSKCDSNGKCCESRNGFSSCCPFSDGVCCEGANTCCRRGYKCDDGQCSLEETDMIVSMIVTETKPTSFDNMNEKHVDCGDGSVCPSRNKCCPELGNGRAAYRCCPLSEGVCCGKTCCPSGYQCTRNGKCLKRQSHFARHPFEDFY